MADTMRNIGALFGDTKTRNIILVTGGILLLAVIFGFYGLNRGTKTGADAEDGFSAVPADLDPTPGP